MQYSYKERKMDGNNSQRLSQKDKFDKDSICDILEQAETISQRVLESIQETASTTHLQETLSNNED